MSRTLGGDRRTDTLGGDSHRQLRELLGPAAPAKVGAMEPGPARAFQTLSPFSVPSSSPGNGGPAPPNSPARVWEHPGGHVVDPCGWWQELGRSCPGGAGTPLSQIFRAPGVQDPRDPLFHGLSMPWGCRIASSRTLRALAVQGPPFQGSSGR